MTHLIKTALCAGAALFGMSAPMSANAANNPDMYVVVFRADWCGPCRILEPQLKQALNSLRDPGLEYVEIDITNPGRSEIGAHRAFDRQIVPQYNKWLGVTGFAVMIDADTKNTLGCVNIEYDAGSMAKHIKNLKTYAVTNRRANDLTCPAANN